MADEQIIQEGEIVNPPPAVNPHPVEEVSTPVLTPEQVNEASRIASETAKVSVAKSEAELKPKLMSFPEAVRMVTEGKKITKLEWDNKKIYGYLSKATLHLTLHKEDGVGYDWICSEGDLTGDDFIVID